MREEDGNMASWSVSRIMSSLKGNFRTKDFNKLEDVLTEKEEKLRREIEKLKHEKQSYKDRYDSERLDKLNVKKELTEELKRCKMERKVFSDQIARLSKENNVLRKELGKKDNEIVSLKEKKSEIESSKAMAEAKIESLSKRDEELSRRVSRLESDVALLTNAKNVENMERTEDKVNTDSKKEDVGVGNDNGNLQNEGNGGVCEGKDVERNAEKTSNADLVDASTCLQNKGTGHSVMIIDSDDDRVPSGIQKRKEPTLSCPTVVTRIGESREAVRFKKIFKRKRAMSEENSDGNACSGKNKMKLSEPVIEPEKAVSSGSYDIGEKTTTTTSRLGLETTRQDEEKLESELRSSNVISGFPLGSFCYESDSASDSDSDSGDDDVGGIENIDLNIYRNAYVI